MRLSDSLSGGILTAERLFPYKNANFITLMHTIVYRSRYQIAPVTVFTGCKAKRVSTVNDSFNEVRSEKLMPPVVGVRQLFSSSHGGKKQRGGPIYRYLVIQKINHPHPDPPPSTPEADLRQGGGNDEVAKRCERPPFAPSFQ